MVSDSREKVEETATQAIEQDEHTFFQDKFRVLFNNSHSLPERPTDQIDCSFLCSSVLIRIHDRGL